MRRTSKPMSLTVKALEAYIESESKLRAAAATDAKVTAVQHHHASTSAAMVSSASAADVPLDQTIKDDAEFEVIASRICGPQVKKSEESAFAKNTEIGRLISELEAHANELFTNGFESAAAESHTGPDSGPEGVPAGAIAKLVNGGPPKIPKLK
jgi:hypothetical protein